MRTINLYGVKHAYPADFEQLSEFLREVCAAIDLTVPIKDVKSETKVRQAALKEIRENHNKSIEYSWVQNYERMGR